LGALAVDFAGLALADFSDYGLAQDYGQALAQAPLAQETAPAPSEKPNNRLALGAIVVAAIIVVGGFAVMLGRHQEAADTR